MRMRGHAPTCGRKDKKMNKNFKLVLALVLAAMMIVSMIPAMAAEVTEPTVKITGLAQGDVVRLYHVLKWVGSENANAVSGWIATSDYTTPLTSDVLKPILGVGVDQATGIPATMAGKLARYATDATLVQTKTLSDGTFTSDALAEPGMYMAIITPADADTVYNPVFVSSDYSSDANTSEWEVNTSASYIPGSTEAAAKKGTTELEKTANTSEDVKWDDLTDETLTVGGSAGKLHWTTVAAGDTVEFEVVTTIPGYGNIFQQPTFNITDTLTNMKLVGEPEVSVYDTGLQITQYTLTGGAGDTSYTIAFNSAYLKTITAPLKIKVVYQAKVNADAPLNVNPRKNEVTTTYSHDPSTEIEGQPGSDEKNYKKDVTNHYTFTIDANGIFHNISESISVEKGTELVKTGIDANGNPITTSSTYSTIVDNKVEEVKGPLADAVFGIYTDEDCNVIYQPKDADGAPDTVNYPNGLRVTTGADGRMTFPGLDAGTYYLKEITAPTGYVASTEVLRIDIEAKVSKKEITEWTRDGQTWLPASDTIPESERHSYTYEAEVLDSYSIKINNQPIATHTFVNNGTSADVVWNSTDAGTSEIPYSIQNVRGVELPSTGGIGTTIFYVGGSLMVLAAAILLITKRRMGAED